MATYGNNRTTAETPTIYTGSQGAVGVTILYTVPAGKSADIYLRAMTGIVQAQTTTGGNELLTNPISFFTGAIIFKLGPAERIFADNASSWYFLVIEFDTTP